MTARPSTREVRTELRAGLVLLGLGALAGLLTSAYDAAWLLGQGVRLRSVAALSGVLGAMGLGLASALWLLSGVAAAIRRALGDRIRVELLEAALVSALSWPVWATAFAGKGVSRTWLGAAGTPLACAATWLGAALLATFARRLIAGSGRTPALVAGSTALCLSVAGGLLVVDRHAYPHGYAQLHQLLLACAMGAVLFVLRLIACSPLTAGVGLATTLALAPLVASFPRDRAERELLSGRPCAAMRPLHTLRRLVDLDGDGSSPLFGGGDCDDANPQAHPGAQERAGDGVDSDCDGQDAPPPYVLRPEPFRVASERARAIVAAAHGRPTVVLIIDALRADRIGDVRFRNLAALAKESVLFTHAYSSSSSTATSLPTMLTGRLPPRSGDRSVAEYLARAGRRAAYVSVDVVAESLRGEVAVRRHFEHDALAGFDPIVLLPTEHDRKGWGGNVVAATNAALTARALELLDGAQPPDLLVVHYFDLHQWNFLELEGLPPRMDYARYDAVLAHVDAGLAPWLARRDALNLVLLSDHGEAVGVRGEAFHTRFLFREMALVPWLIRVPGVSPARVQTPVGLQALTPTLLELLGTAVAPELPVGSLLGLVGVNEPGPGPGFAAFDELQWSLLYGSYRLLYTPETHLVQLFDLSTDPMEQVSVAPREPALSRALLQRLHAEHRGLR